MQDNSIPFNASFKIVYHLCLNKWVSKFSHHMNTFSWLPLYIRALFTKLSILFFILAPYLLSSSYILRFALPAATTSFRCSMHSCVSSILLLYSNISFTLAIFFSVCNLFRKYFHFHIPSLEVQLHLLHLLHYDLKLCEWMVSTCCSVSSISGSVFLH